jgi:hypothetical protein
LEEGKSMPSEENQISDILRKLNSKGIPHMIIGGVPAILYGVERPTYDIDIAVPEDLAVLTEIIDILKNLEYEDLELFPVDILAVGTDLFQELSKEVIKIPFKNSFMLCPSIQKLIEMKEAVGRPEDIDDVRKLRQILGKLEKKYYE